MSPKTGKRYARRSRRHHRYREIVTILWEERVFRLIRAAGMERDAPGPLPADTDAALNQAVDDATGVGEGDGQRAPRQVPYEVRVRLALERLGPAFVKLGQILSSRRDLIDPALATELAKLQDHVPAEPWSDMAEILKDELGGSPDEVFAEFDPEPIAAASIGQVYRARLHDGRVVAVKVQRPGVRETMETDLDILVTQAHFVAQRTEWGRTQNVAAIADEIVRVLRGELDYLQEARNMERFREAFASSDEVFFPAPVWELTTSHVLTMEMVDGIPGTDVAALDAGGVDRKRMVANGVDCYFRQIFDMGVYHADPHAGNLFSLPDGRVGFVDFGRVATISHQSRQAVFEMLLSVMDDDPVDATEALLSICTAPRSLDLRSLQGDLARIVALFRESQGHPDVLQVTLQETLSATRKHRLGMPGEIAVLLTTLGVLEGVAQQIDPGFKVIDAAKPFAQAVFMKSFGPQAWRHEAVRSLRRYRKLADDLPVALTRTLRRASEGEFQIAVRPEHFDDVMRAIKDVANRLALAIVVAAFVLAFAYISARETLPDWIRWAAGTVLGLAALMALGLLGAIVFALLRRRRRL
jgi:ubiquinone biosynthesis protein